MYNLKSSFENNFERYSKAEKYLQNKYEELENNYRTEENHLHSCTLLASDIAELILAEGDNPRILSVRGQKIDSLNTVSIVPIRYEGRVSWGAHIVCAVNDTVFDPLVGKPMELSLYTNSIFSEPVEVSE